MPAFKLNGKVLIYFAAFEKHIGLYPFPSAVKAFAKETATYKTAKGSIQLPLDQKLPVTMIAKIIKFRIEETSR